MHRPPQSSVFSREQALTAGWSDSALHRAVHSGRIVRLRPGLFALPAAAGERTLAEAAARSCAGSVVSHRSALLRHGLPLVGELPRRPEVTVPRHATGNLRGAHLRRSALRPRDVVDVSGVPTTSVARTLVDVGRSASLRTSVSAIDAALHVGRTSVDDLIDVAAFCRRWPGSRKATKAIALSDRRAESPLESCSRLTLAQVGLPSPDLQPVLRSLDGRFLGRPDFYWDEMGVVGEADGRIKYNDRAALIAEKDRQELLEDAGLVVVRWGWNDLARPNSLARRIERAFGRGKIRATNHREWSVESVRTGQPG